MIALVTLSSAWNWGCIKPSIVPPTTSIGRSSRRSLPNVTRVYPRRTIPKFPTPSVPTGNPWKPTVTEREWKYIVIHHTASSSGSVESIHETHLKRKDKSGNPWMGIGYHFVIGNGSGMDDGEIQPTFRWKQQLHGAHAGMTDYNQHGIGIVLVGNFEEQSPSPAQIAAVKRLVGILKNEYTLASNDVVGHGSIKATECPGKFFPLAEVSRSSFVPSLTKIYSRPASFRLASVKGLTK